MPTASVLGLDTATGACLARLLDAHGYALRGRGGSSLLERLGVAGGVTYDDCPVVVVDKVYDLLGDPAATSGLLDPIPRAHLRCHRP